MLLASVLQAASSAVQTQKRPLRKQTAVQALRVTARQWSCCAGAVLSNLHWCAHVFDECSLHLWHQLRAATERAGGKNASSPHNHSARRTLRVVAVDEQA